ncbi:MAG: uridine kinase family protein [Christensenellales bacterium]|jgi:uridine kinase
MNGKCIILNNGTKTEYPIMPGIRLCDIAKDLKVDGAICALMNGCIVSLAKAPTPGAKVAFLSPADSQHASRVFLRGATFLLYCAAKALFPSRPLLVDHALYGGVFCRIDHVTENDIAALSEKIEEYIASDEDFIPKRMNVSEAKKIMLSQGLNFKAALLSYRPFDYYNMYEFDGVKNYFHGIMPKSAGYLKGVRLFAYSDGFILKYPAPYIETATSIIKQPKYAAVFSQAENWARVLCASYVSDINDKLKSGNIVDFININEALHEQTIAKIANKIEESRGVRVVLIAGPSSSGKTTFASRLAVHLRAIGRKCQTISVDDYYKNREDIPQDSGGNRDFEHIEAFDVRKLNDDLGKLLLGETAELPTFDFVAGKRKEVTVPLRICGDLLIIEGIHGLNDELTKGIPADKKFKIFVSPLTTLNLDSHNVVFPDDLRLIRRLVRDKRARGYSFEQTFAIWDSVRKGEYMYILPYQETADVMFNTTLLYEPLILKKHCCEDLSRFTPDMPNFPEAQSLLKLLSYFLSMDDESMIPISSILREFIGR